MRDEEVVGGQRWPVSAACGERPEVEADAPDHELLRRGRALRPAQQGAGASQQLRHGEGLREVVVGAQLEAPDPVGDVAAGGQQQDRQSLPRVPQLTDHVEAGAARQHHVQDQQVRRLAPDRPGHLDPAAQHLHGGALLAQVVRDGPGKTRLVLHEEHAPGPGRACASRAGELAGSTRLKMQPKPSEVSSSTYPPSARATWSTR
jgi:hypothetical protein